MFTSTDSFTYKASDGVSTSAAATVTLTVTGSAPTANNDVYQAVENTTLSTEYNGVLLNDTSPDNMPLTATLLTQPTHGTLTPFSSNGGFQYTPNHNFVGTDTFTYEASDGSLTSAPATVTINVEASNSTPAAANLSYSVDENSSLSTDSSSGVMTGASDSDGDALWAMEMQPPQNGTLQFNTDNGQGSSFGDGSFTYTPNAGFYGTDSFTYATYDGINLSNTATVTITVNEDVPSVANASYSVLPTGTTSVTAANGVLSTASDPDGAALTAHVVNQPSYGSLIFNSDGSFSYTPGNHFHGSDSFTYEAYNGTAYSTPATVTLTTAPVNVAQTYGVNHDTTLSVDSSDGLLSGAYDADGDTLTAALATGASNGTVTVHSDGSFTYVPKAGYTGTDSFTYTVSDGTQTSAPATVTIQVTDSVPTANPQSWDTPENTALTVNGVNGVLASASDDDGDALTAQLAGVPSNGMLDLGSDGAIVYTPDPNFFGTDSFTYAAFDGVSTSTPATVSINVDQIIPENLQNSVPSAVTVADFNNDGNPDVAMADQGLNTVSVYLDNSSGVVASTPVSTTTVGSAPVALAAADFNNDSNQDLAVANSGSNTVSILLGNGSGGFTTGTTLTGFDDPVAVVAGNFGNGEEDLAVVNKGNNTVSILLGNGNGTFTAANSLTTGSSPTSIAAADFNNDGKLDLVVTNSASNSVSVFLGNGNGTFATGLTDAVGTAPMSVTTGDFNGDGNVDVAVANSGSNNVSVLLGNGDGSFQTAVNYAVGSNPVAIAAGDFDGNGFLNLSVANKGGNTLTNLSNYGDGEFFLADTSSAVSDPVSIATGDFNHDGLIDQVIAMADPKMEILKGRYDTNAEQITLGPVAISSKGTVAAAMRTVSDKKDLLRFWNANTRRSIYSTWVTSVPITGLVFSTDGSQLAVAGGDNVFLWDVPDDKPADNQPGEGPKGQMSQSVSFSADNVSTILEAGTNGGKLEDWTNKPKEIGKNAGSAPQNDTGAPVTALAWTNSPTFAALSPKVIKVWTAKTPWELARTLQTPPQATYKFSAMAFSATTNPQFFVIGYTDGDLDLFTTQNGVPAAERVNRVSNANRSEVLGVVFSTQTQLFEVTSNEIKALTVKDNKLTDGAVLQVPKGNTAQAIAVGTYKNSKGDAETDIAVTASVLEGADQQGAIFVFNAAGWEGDMKKARVLR